MRTYARPINNTNEEIIVPMFFIDIEHLGLQKQQLKPHTKGNIYPITKEGMLDLLNSKANPVIDKGADGEEILILEYEPLTI